MNKYEELNKIYKKHSDKCEGNFHNALWQIMINESCTGAFVYITSEDTIGVTQSDGGYVPALFNIKEARQSVLADLNLEVFGLDDQGVFGCEFESMLMNGGAS